jgi:peptide/nickel transport system ATP-binding protein
MGLLLISHDLAMVGEYCDQLAVMKGGKIVESGLVKTVFKAPQHPYTRSLLTAALHLQLREEKSTAIQGKETVLKVDNLKQYYSLVFSRKKRNLLKR